MNYIFAVPFTLIMLCCFLSHILTLPGNWLMLILFWLWLFMQGAVSDNGILLLLILGINIVGEIVEFSAGYFGAQKYGGTRKGSVAGIVGAITGAILGVPFFFGFGALLGALAGAFTGCYLMEVLQGREKEAALAAATGTLLGRFLGTVTKLALGVVILILSLPVVWGG